MDHSSLSVEVSNHSNIPRGGVIIRGGYGDIGLWRDHLLGGEQLTHEGPGGLLLLQGESNGTLTSMLLLQSFASVNQGG
jgi:hypothetical protein